MSAMTTRTICCASVVIGSAVPLAGIVASGALDGKVVVSTMTIGAAANSSVIEHNIAPIADGVTEGALRAIMNAGRLVLVARHAVVSAGVVKPDPGPFVAAVAEGALAGIVYLFAQRVARLTVKKAVVIEPRLRPVIGIVAVGALCIIVVFWTVLLCVAILAIVKSSMVKPRLFPVVNVMTPRTLPLVMVFWDFFVFQVACLAVG